MREGNYTCCSVGGRGKQLDPDLYQRVKITHIFARKFQCVLLLSSAVCWKVQLAICPGIWLFSFCKLHDLGEYGWKPPREREQQSNVHLLPTRNRKIPHLSGLTQLCNVCKCVWPNYSLAILPIFIGTKTLHYPTILSYFYDNECVWNKNASAMLDGVHGRTTAISEMVLHGDTYSPHAAVIHCLTREINWLIIRWENYLSPHTAPLVF